MYTWIVLLRGINVGGKHRLPMSELVSALQSLKFDNVKTYIQSGNAVVQSSHLDAPSTLAASIETTIQERHGFRPRVLLLSARELEHAIALNPFPQAVAEPRTLHLFFLAATPSAPAMDALSAARAPTEQFHLTDHVFYLHTPDGLGRSRLANNVERHLGVPATARNWRTVQKLWDLVKEME